jgi:uncharacterized cysteine cluster protein YcgN (CxxCxxCC family)
LNSSSSLLLQEVHKAAAYFREDAARRGIRPISRLYTVLDHGGGWRFVVTPRWEIKHHLVEKERAIMVPKVLIAEPVGWDDLPRTIRLAERYATAKMSGRNACGKCEQCCITLRINEKQLIKPAHSRCQYLDALLGGCGIYPARPPVCKAFECEWLKSQRLNDKMHPDLRPDKCGVIFTTATSVNNFDPEIIEAHPDVHRKTDPFKGKLVRRHIAALEKFGQRVIRVTHYEDV